MTNDVWSSLVSIIVPFYNEEKYLTECIASILNQTHDNIEIIMVDDGSYDNSMKIAKSFEAKDSRVNIFSQKNKGVSVARNFALEKSSGTYVVFVDSDDYLMPDFVDYMLTIVKETQAEFCISTNIFTHMNMSQVHNDRIEIYSPEDATCALLYPWITIGCWNKIYKKEFLCINKIRFPETFFMGEGLNFIIKSAQLSKKIGVGHKKVYFYRTDNYESATRKFNINKLINAFEAIENIRNNLIIDSPKVLRALNFHLWLTHIYALQSIMSASEHEFHKKFFNQCVLYLKTNSLSMIKADIPIFMKLKVLFIYISPKFAVGLLVFLKKILRIVKAN